MCVHWRVQGSTRSPTGISSRRRVLGPTTDPSLTEWMFHQSVSYDVCVSVCVCVCVHVCVHCLVQGSTSSPTGIGSRRRVLGPTTDPSLTEWMFH